jgi:hypothetical protein
MTIGARTVAAANTQQVVRIERQMTYKPPVAPFGERIDFANLLPAVQLDNLGKARHRRRAQAVLLSFFMKQWLRASHAE